jgi:hypothetical protein
LLGGTEVGNVITLAVAVYDMYVSYRCR